MKINTIQQLLDLMEKLEPELVDPIFVVGSLATRGESNNDVDVVVTNPQDGLILSRHISNLDLISNVVPHTSQFLLFNSRNARGKVRPFQLVKVIRPAKKAFALPAETYSIEQLLKILPKDIKEIDISWKADGIRTQLHRVGDKLQFLTDEANVIPENKVAPILAEAQKHYPNIFILDGEIVLYLNGVLQKREDVVAYLRRKEEPNKAELTGIRFKPFDVLYFNGKPIADEPLRDRIAILKRYFPDTKHIHKIERTRLKAPFTATNLASAIKKVTSREGVVIRDLDSTYWESSRMFKLKWQIEVDLLVVKKEITKNKTYVYTCATREGIVVGKTYPQSSFNANVGDVIRVAIENLTKRVVDGQIIYTWYSPRVTGIKGEASGKAVEGAKQIKIGSIIDVTNFPLRRKADSIKTLELIYEKSGGK